MKITLITTLPSLSENKRIKEEIELMGHKFSLVDLSDFSFSIKNGKLILDEVNKKNTDIIILRGIFNSIKPISTIINNLKKKGVKIFDNNFIEHKYSIDKITDLIKLSQNNIPTPDICYSRDFNKFPALADSIGYPLIVKSTRAGKGASVFKLDNKTALFSLIDNLKNEGKNAKSYLLQKFIDYKYDLRCLVVGENVFTMRRIPAKGEFRANFSLGGSVEVFDLDEKGKNLAIKALDAVEMDIGGVDILITKNNLRYVLEVNHTAGFVGMEKATKENIAKYFVECAIENAK